MGTFGSVDVIGELVNLLNMATGHAVLLFELLAVAVAVMIAVMIAAMVAVMVVAFARMKVAPMEAAMLEVVPIPARELHWEEVFCLYYLHHRCELRQVQSRRAGVVLCRAPAFAFAMPPRPSLAIPQTGSRRGILLLLLPSPPS